MKSSGWIDISYHLNEELIHWPQDPVPPNIKTNSAVIEGEGTVTMTQMTINTHHGTHVDAPRHFFPDGASIDEMPLDTLMGPVRIIEIYNTDLIVPEELEKHDIQSGEKILFKTVNSSYYREGRFMEDFVHFRSEGATFLKQKKISAVGVDYLAVGSFRDRPSLIEVHKIFLGSNIWIIEALDLSAVTAGNYEMICLPLGIRQGDAAQARAIVRPV